MYKINSGFTKEKNLLLISSAISLTYIFLDLKSIRFPYDTALFVLLFLNLYYLFRVLLNIFISDISSLTTYLYTLIGVLSTALIINNLSNHIFIWNINKAEAVMLLILGEFIASSLSPNVQNILYIRSEDESIKNHLPQIPFIIKKDFTLLYISAGLLLFTALYTYFLMDEALKAYWFIILLLPLSTHFANLIIYFSFKESDIIESNKKILEQNDRHEILVEISKKLSNKDSLYCRKTNTMQYNAILHYLNNGQNPNEVFENRYTLLLPSTCCGDYKLTKLLIEHGSDVNFRSSLGTYALHLACEHGFCDIVKLLIDNGADINLIDNNGKTALMYAQANGHIDVLNILYSNKQ